MVLEDLAGSETFTCPILTVIPVLVGCLEDYQLPDVLFDHLLAFQPGLVL